MAMLVASEQLSFRLTPSIPRIAFGSDFAFARKDFVVSESSDRSGSSHPADSSAGAALQLVGSTLCFGQGARRGLVCRAAVLLLLTPARTML